MPWPAQLKRGLALLPFLLLAGCSADRFDADGCTEGVRVGDCAPDFTSTDSTGEALSLRDNLGAELVLLFGEMW